GAGGIDAHEVAALTGELEASGYHAYLRQYVDARIASLLVDDVTDPYVAMKRRGQVEELQRLVTPLFVQSLALAALARPARAPARRGGPLPRRARAPAATGGATPPTSSRCRKPCRPTSPSRRPHPPPPPARPRRRRLRDPPKSTSTPASRSSRPTSPAHGPIT